MPVVFDYIIIGSGFGGSVSALRLAEKGYKVLMIEKGRRFMPEDFPETNWKIRKYLWRPAFGFYGFQGIRLFRKMLVLYGTGYGGGSLGYAATLMQPEEKYFSHPAWSDFDDWKHKLYPFYGIAKKMLGSARYHCLHEEDLILKILAEGKGRADTFSTVETGIYFNVNKEESDPYFNGDGPSRKPCTECAGCMVGCRENAKNSLDKNYLFLAEKRGINVKTGTLAYKLEYTNNQYFIHCKNSLNHFNKNTEVFVSKGLILAGGVLGTLDLLMKQKYKYKTLADLSSKLGENLLSNSESLCGIISRKIKLNNGTAITSCFHPDDKTLVELVKYPAGSGLMKLIGLVATPGSNPYIRVFKLIYNTLRYFPRIINFLFTRNIADKTIIFLTMQTEDHADKMIWSGFPFFRIKIKRTKVSVRSAYIPQGQEVLMDYSKKVDGFPLNIFSEVICNAQTTAHILGGCPMGRDSKSGVIDSQFRVFGYPEMYILDGSVIQCNPGVNPSLTITAVAEYAMSLIPEKGTGQYFSRKF